MKKYINTKRVYRYIIKKIMVIYTIKKYIYSEIV